jgi:hypothetical protein
MKRCPIHAISYLPSAISSSLFVPSAIGSFFRGSYYRLYAIGSYFPRSCHLPFAISYKLLSPTVSSPLLRVLGCERFDPNPLR